MFAREELIEEALRLDPLPASSMRLTRILAQEDWSLDEVAKTVALDPVLTGAVLRYVNSAASGAQTKITSVSQAVMRMGPNMVQSIAISNGLMAQMLTDLPAYGLDEGALFRHSVGSAIAIEALRRVGTKPPGGCFIAALVHDVGKLVIGRKLKKMGIRLTTSDGQSPATGDEAEQLGIDHAELGAEVARAWELPAGVPEAVQFHHRPQDLEPGVPKVMAQMVAAADAIAHALDDDDQPAWDPVATMHLGLGPADQEKVRAAAAKMLEGVLQLYA